MKKFWSHFCYGVEFITFLLKCSRGKYYKTIDLNRYKPKYYRGFSLKIPQVIKPVKKLFGVRRQPNFFHVNLFSILTICGLKKLCIINFEFSLSSLLLKQNRIWCTINEFIMHWPAWPSVWPNFNSNCCASPLGLSRFK